MINKPFWHSRLRLSPKPPEPTNTAKLYQVRFWRDGGTSCHYLRTQSKLMANGVGVDKTAVFRESSVSNAKISKATTALQRTAAALMASHSDDDRGRVIYIPPVATSGPCFATSTPGENLKPALTSKAGISFVIPKNKLSGALVPVVRTVPPTWEPNEVKNEEEGKVLSQRKTKWGIDLTQDPVVMKARALALQTRAEQIAAQLESGQLDIDTNESTRSPSPPPIYDSNGQRTNTREGRRREQLEIERREAIGECLQLNPTYKPPSGYKPLYKEAKLYIPVKDYPGYNFIGLILGPRGNTQKRMETETGSKIAIRGKGAVKEGKKCNAVRLQGGRRDGKEADGAFEDLHVHITADSIEKVDAAVALIEPLLTPVDEDRNTHKRKQLRELAEMNGTMRDFPKACCVCGETGHREWHCPKDKLYTFQAKVCCQVCGDGGHPTIDCPKDAGQGKVLDKEYLSFLEELGDGLAGVSAGSSLGLASNCTSGENTKDSEAVSATARTGPNEDSSPLISETSLDPNQLADVISGPQPMLITAAGPQPMPPAWTTVGMFPSPFEVRMGTQQGSFLQVERDRQFQNLPNLSRSPLHLPGTGTFNVYTGPLAHPGHPPFGGSLVVRGQPPSAMNVTTPASAPNIVSSTGVYRLAESNNPGGPFSGNKVGGACFVPFPVPHPAGPLMGAAHIQNPPSLVITSSKSTSLNEASFISSNARVASTAVPPVTGRLSFVPSLPSSSGLTSSWNPNVPTHATWAGTVPMTWESTSHPRPLPSWESEPMPQPPVQQLPIVPPWDTGPPSRPTTASRQSPSHSWEVQHKPWEVTPLPPFSSQSPSTSAIAPPQPTATLGTPNPPWNPSHQPLLGPLQPPSQPWNVAQPQYPHYPPDGFPGSGSRQPLWKGSPFPLPMPTSKPPTPVQFPYIMASPQLGQSSSLPFPPWHHQAHQNLQPGTLTGPSCPIPRMVHLGGSLPQPVLSEVTWGQQFGGDVVRPGSCPPIPVSSHADRSGKQVQQYDPFTPAAAHVLSSSNLHHQQVGALVVAVPAPTGVGSLPGTNGGWTQPGPSLGHTSWHSANPLGNNQSSAPPVVPSNAPDDAEYEKLMASVGVT